MARVPRSKLRAGSDVDDYGQLLAKAALTLTLRLVSKSKCRCLEANQAILSPLRFEAVTFFS